MSERIEPINGKLSVVTVGDRRLVILPLNGSAAFFPQPWTDLSHLVYILGLPDHPESAVQLRNIGLRHITKILGIEKSTPEDEAQLTAVLSGTVTETTELSVQARIINFHLGPTPMAAALVELTDTLIPYRIPPHLLMITDLPRN